MATSLDSVLLALILDHCAKNGWHAAAEQLRNEAHSKGNTSANLPPAFVESHYSFLTEWFGMFWEFFKRRANASYSELRRPPQSQQNVAANNINIPNNHNHNHNHNSHIQHQQYVHHHQHQQAQQQQQLHHHQNSFQSPANPSAGPRQEIAMGEALTQFIAGQAQGQSTQSIAVATAAAVQANLRSQIRPRGTPTPPAVPVPVPVPGAVGAQQAQQGPNTPTGYMNPLEISKQFPANAAAAAAAVGNMNIRRSPAESLRKNAAAPDNSTAAAIALQQQMNQKKRPSAGSGNVSMDSAVMQANIRAGAGSQMPNGPKKRARVTNSYPGRPEDIMRNMSPQQQQMFQNRFQQHHQNTQTAEHHHQQQLQAMAQMDGFNHLQIQQHQQSNPMQTPNSRRSNNNDPYLMHQQHRRLQQLHRQGGAHQKMPAQNANRNSNPRNKNNNVPDMNTSSAIDIGLLGDNGSNANALGQQQSNELFFSMGGNPTSPAAVVAQNRAQGGQQQRAQYGARISKKAANNTQRAAAAAVAVASSGNSTGGPNAGSFNANNPAESNINIPASQQQRTPSFTTGNTPNGMHDDDNKGMMPPPYANQSQTNTGRVARNKASGGNTGGNGGASEVTGAVAETNGDTKPTTGGGTPSQRSVASGVSNGAEPSGTNNTSSRKSKTNRAKRTGRNAGRRKNNNTTSPSTSRKNNNAAESTSNVTKKSPKKSAANNAEKNSSSKKQKSSSAGVAAAMDKKNVNVNTTAPTAVPVPQPQSAPPPVKKDVSIGTDEFVQFPMNEFMVSHFAAPPLTGGTGAANQPTGAQGQQAVPPPPSYQLPEDMEELGMLETLGLDTSLDEFV